MCFALSSTLLAAFFIHFWGQSVSHLLDASTIKHFRSGKKVCNFSMTQRQATRFLTQILCVCENGWFTGQILSISKPYNVGPFINPMNTIVIGTINHSYWSYLHQLNAIVWGPHFVPTSSNALILVVAPCGQRSVWGLSVVLGKAGFFHRDSILGVETRHKLSLQGGAPQL